MTTYDRLEEAIRSVDRRLDLLSEEQRTRLDLFGEKLVNGITAIVDKLSTIALDVGQLMGERVENRRQLAEHEKRLVALETEQRDIRALFDKLTAASGRIGRK